MTKRGTGRDRCELSKVHIARLKDGGSKGLLYNGYTNICTASFLKT